MRVNFVKEKTGDENFYQKLIFISVIIILLLILATHYYFISRRLLVLKKDVKTIKSRYNKLLPENDKYLKLKNKINEQNKFKNNYTWNKVIKEFGYIVPDNVRLTSLQINLDKISGNGISRTNQGVVILIENMKESNYFRQVKLVKLDNKQGIKFKLEALIEKGLI